MRNILIGIFFLSLNGLYGQQLPYTTFLHNNWQLINPAARDRFYYLTNVHPDHKITVNYRNQWIGFNEAPKTFLCSWEHSPQANQNQKSDPGIRWGVDFFYDKTDALSSTHLSGNFTYFFGVFDESTLQIGLSPGYFLSQIDINSLTTSVPDPYLQTIDDKKHIFDMGIGVFLLKDNGYYMGLSIPQLMPTNLKKTKPHIYLLAGANFFPGVTEKAITAIEPNLWIRYVPYTNYAFFNRQTPLSIDASVRLYLNRKLWCGAGIGTNKNFSAELGFYPNQKTPYDSGNGNSDFKIGLSYNQGIGNRFNLGPSIEFMTSYAFD